jgi:hypothetical protein
MTGSPPWDPGSNRDRQDPATGVTAYPPQSGFRQQQPQHAGWGSAAAAQGSFTCRLCGSIPAENATFRRVQGLILLVRLWRVHGPFCRDCGLAVFRDQTAKTLVQGWWGFLAFFANSFAVINNVAARGRFARLATPRRNPAAPALYPRPLQPGKPLLRRPVTLMLLIPLLPAVAIGVSIASSAGDGSSDSYVGRCVKVSSGDSAEFVSCSKAHNGQVVAQFDDMFDPNMCPSGTDGYIRRPIEDRLLCVDADK